MTIDYFSHAIIELCAEAVEKQKAERRKENMQENFLIYKGHVIRTTDDVQAIIEEQLLTMPPKGSFESAYWAKVDRCLDLANLLGQCEGILKAVNKSFPSLENIISPLIEKIEAAFNKETKK